jgi:hypothetical protein
MAQSTRHGRGAGFLVAAGIAALSIHTFAVESSQSFTFLQAGFTQELIGVSGNLLTGDVDDDGIPDGILGGVAFAEDGDPLVAECEFTNTRLHRFDLSGAPTDVNGSDLSPETILPSQGGCGLVNHPDGTLYVAMNDGVNGVANVDRETGALLSFMGPPSNALGIAVDPQTNDLVYAAADCRFTGTCTFIRLSPANPAAHSVFAVLPEADANFVDGMYFDPTGNYLFLANRDPEFRLTVLDRTGAVVQHVSMGASEPDGVAFHATAPKFVVTNNIDGTMSRFDFPGDDYTLPPSASTFASGGFRGDLSQVDADGCINLTQKGTRYNDGTETEPTNPENSVVRICGGFAPPPGVGDDEEPPGPQGTPVGEFCEKAPVQTEFSAQGARFPGNAGIDIVVKAHEGQSIQNAIDNVTDINQDGYLIVGVTAKPDGQLGGHVTQAVDIHRAFLAPFALVGCSVTLHDPTPGDANPTGKVAALATAPEDGAGSNIFVMDLHAAGSLVAGWLVEGEKRYLRNVETIGNAVGVKIEGATNTMHNGNATENSSVGVLVIGDGNAVKSADSMENGGAGIQIVGNGNQVYQTDVGERNKGNGGDGIVVNGSGNQLLENDVYGNAGDGIEVRGGAAGSPNVLKKNKVGDRNKGNQRFGVLVEADDSGNAGVNPIELEENTAKANGLGGIRIFGAGHQLKKNVSGGTAADDNIGCEFDVASLNVNATGNKANGTTIAGSNGTPFPTGCKGTP